MKALAIAILLAASALSADGPRVTRPMIVAAESAIDRRFEKLLPDNPYLLLGNARGVYLEGYGVVFSAEVNLIQAAGGPFHTKITKEEAARHRQEKLNRLPTLRTSMKQALLGAALSLDTVPPEEQVVLAVSLFRHSWEDMTGLPQQIVVSAQRGTLVQLQSAGAASTVVEASIQVREY